MIKALAERRFRPPLEALGGRLARLPLSPNHWTLLGLCAGTGAGIAIAARSFAAAAGLILLVLVCDTADGLVARARGRASPFGGLLDVASDKYVEGAIFLGAGAIAPPLLGVPGALFAMLGLWGSIVVSLVANVGAARLGRPAFKLADRATRGLLGVAALLLAAVYGERALTAGLAAVGALSHLTVAGLLGHYWRLSPSGASGR